MRFKTIYHTMLPSDGHIPTTRIELGKEYIVENYHGESTFHIYELEVPIVYNLTFVSDGSIYEEFAKYFYTEQQMIEKMRGDKLDSII